MNAFDTVFCAAVLVICAGGIVWILYLVRTSGRDRLEDAGRAKQIVNRLEKVGAFRDFSSTIEENGIPLPASGEKS